LDKTVSFLGIQKWEPDIYIGFSTALHLQAGNHNKNTAVRRYKIQFGGTALLKELELFSFTKLNIFVGAI
jgi:hypothetical protein